MDPISMLMAALQAASSIGGGILSSGSKETKTQKSQRNLIDDLIASLKGEGSFNDLFKSDQDAFQKSFVDPAKSMFNNQIAPSIQQRYVGSGQQGSSGLNDSLLRAGVDLDQLLNQNYMDFMNKGQDRQQNVIGQILGASSGAQTPGTGQRLAESTGGYLSGDSFTKLLNEFRPDTSRKGFQQDNNGARV